LLKKLARTPARLALPVVLLAAGTAAASAQQPQPAEPQQQREHVVRRGDTLWDLARTYLSNPFQWPAIYEANRNVVKDPHWIYPAERLIIPPLLRQPLQQGGFAEPIGEPMLPGEPAGDPLLTVSLVTDAAEPVEQDVPPTVVSTLDMRRPVVAAAEYRRSPWIGPPVQGVPAARITRKADPASAADRLQVTLLPNERVYISAPAVAAGDSLLVVRPGGAVGSWGQIMQPVGIVRVDSVWPQQSLASLVSQFGETRVGDMLLPLEPEPAMPMGEAGDVATGPTGVLLRFVSDHLLYGTAQLGFVSLGRVDGLGIGDEFAVYVPAEGVIPETRIATLRVVRTAERTATVRVIGANSTALRDGLPVRLIRKVP
jgi:hypothetical protein